MKSKELLEEMRTAYGEGAVIPDGLLGDKSMEPTSLGAFTMVMLILAAVSTYVMNIRKQGILMETYKTLSIFKKK